MITCKKCGEEKPEDQIAKYAGELTETCKACRFAHAGGKGPAKKKRKAGARKEPIDVSVTELEVLPGLGFKAFLTEDDRLQIQQKNDGGPDDNVVLSKTEFKVISAQFAEWRDSPVK